MTQEGLRSVPETCFACKEHVECLKEALSSPKGLRLKEEKVASSEDPELVKRYKLWSLRKEAAQQQEAQKRSLLSPSNLKSLLITPWEFYSPQNRLTGTDAFSFGLLWGGIGSMLGYFWQFMLTKEGLMDLGLLKEAPGILDNYLTIGLLIPLMVIVEILLGSLAWHFVLTLVGGNRGGFKATFSGISSAEAVMVLSLIPIVGPIMAQPWKFWIQLVAMKHMHNTSYARIIWSFVLLILCTIGLAVLLSGLVAYFVLKGKGI